MSVIEAVSERGLRHVVVRGCDPEVHAGVIFEMVADGIGGEARSLVVSSLDGRLRRLEPHRLVVIEAGMDVEELISDIGCHDDACEGVR